MSIFDKNISVIMFCNQRKPKTIALWVLSDLCFFMTEAHKERKYGIVKKNLETVLILEILFVSHSEAVTLPQICGCF